MAEVVFFIAAIGAIAGAGGTVALRNPFYSVLALVGHLLCLAALFLLLRAEFVAAAQVVVYAGAVMVLYVFVSAYIGRVDHSVGPNPGPGLKGLSFAFAGALLIEFFVAILGTGLDALDQQGSGWFPGFGSPREIGKLLLTDYLLAFEVASFLLLVAAVGAVILARRREGLEPMGTLSVSDLFAEPEDAGTIEGHEVGSILEAGGSPKR
jgi:NADH:ubiquinone oxidoreductase subunit 6 (subunit J)